ncbi:MAG: hypothetical protein ABSC30_17685 [Acidimicrobiales bacterium]
MRQGRSKELERLDPFKLDSDHWLHCSHRWCVWDQDGHENIGFWVVWHQVGDFKALEHAGWHRTTIFRKLRRIRATFGVHPDERSCAWITRELEQFWKADLDTRLAAHQRLLDLDDWD